MKPRYIGIPLFLIFSLLGQANAQCLFSCNGQVNVSLDVDCEVDITLNMLVAGEPPESCYVSYSIEGIDGTIISEPGWFEYTVTNDVSGASCSGYLLVEDKLPPVIDCECESYLVDVNYLHGILDGNSQIYNRPFAVADVACESGFGVSYELFEFEIESYGSTNFQSTSFDIIGDNLFLALYENCFNPSQPCNNLIEIGGAGSGFANLSMILEQGQTYYLVISSFVNSGIYFGDFFIDASVANGTVIIKNPHCKFRCTDLLDPTLLEIILPPLEVPYDNCGEFLTLEPSIVVSEAEECGSMLVTRSTGYTYNLNTGYQLTEYCVEEYLFEAIQLTGPGNTIDGVWEEYPASGVHDYYFPEQEIVMPCGSGIHPSYIMEYFDIDTPATPSGDEDDYVQSEVLVENHEGIPYAFPYFVTKGFDGNYHASPLVNPTCNLNVSYQDQLYDLCGPGCYGNSKTIRTWTLYDWCKGTTVNFEQLIKITDIDGPDLSVSDITVSVDPWDCFADIEMPAPDHLTDDCDNETNYWVQGPLGIVMSGYTALHVPIGAHIFTYYGQDCCGNTSTSEVKVTVRDNTAPVAITTESIVVQLTSNFQGNGIAKLYAEDVDNHSYDGCSDVKVEIRRNDGNIWCHEGNASFNNDGHNDDLDTDDDNGEFVKFCCEDLILIDENGQTYGLFEVQIRVWDDGDGNGVFGTAGDNYNEAWTTVRVEDKVAPLVVCPDHIELTCEQDFANMQITGEPTAEGACFPSYCDSPNDSYTKKPASSAPFVGEEIPAYNPSCRVGAIKRTWYCGGSNCLQWIIMRPTEEGPIEIDWPDDQTVDCLGGEYGEPIFTDRICETIGTSLKSDTFFFETGTCFKILNKWSVINWCSYDPTDPDNNDIPEPGLDDGFAEGVYTHTQIIRLFDSVDPIISVQDTTISSEADCIADQLILHGSAIDNGACGSDWLKWVVEIDLNNDWEVDYTFSTAYSPSDPFYLPPTMDTMYVELPDGIESNCSRQHRVHWKVEDGCGNFASKTQYVTIKDLKKPTPYCLNLGSALMENGRVELWAKDFNAGSFDNCTSEAYLSYTFSSNTPPQLNDPTEEDPWYNDSGVTTLNNYITGDAESWDAETKSSSKIFDCDELEESYNNGGVYMLDVYVWDLCGNFDYCQVNLQLTDNELACGLSDPRAMVAGRVYKESGETIEGVVMSLESEQVGYPKEIITDFAGEYSFENNPMYIDYRLSGFDNDGWLNGVSTFDLILIQKHILGQKDLESPYKMIAADANNDEKISGVDLIKLRKLILGIEVEIVGNTSWRLIPQNIQMDAHHPWPFDEVISIGNLDANESQLDFIGVKVGDVNDSAVVDLGSDHLSERSLPQMSLLVLENFEQGKRKIDFITKETLNLAGFQFALSDIKTKGIEIESDRLNLASENINFLENTILISWNTKTNMTMEEGVVLFSVILEDNNSSLKLAPSILNSEIYIGDIPKTYELKIEDVNMGNEIGLLEIAPNPFNEQATISFIFEKEEEYQLIFTDISGKVLQTFESVGQAGFNSMVIDKNRLGLNNGLCFYSLVTNTLNYTKKAYIVD